MVYHSIRNIERAATFIGRCTERNLLMKRKKLLPLAAAALACGVLIAAPQAASALAPDQAAPEVLGQANDYYYYEDDGYISYDDTYGYIRLDQDELYLTIQPGSSSTSQYLKVLYVEDQSSRITWTSSNASVATVDGNGCVTGWSQGTAIITARSAGGSVGSCIGYVDEASQLNTSVQQPPAPQPAVSEEQERL